LDAPAEPAGCPTHMVMYESAYRQPPQHKPYELHNIYLFIRKGDY
jgi:hypothetical protein